MTFSTEILFLLSKTLLVPLVLALALLAVWTLLELGGFIRESLRRFKRRKTAPSLFARIAGAPETEQRRIALEFFERNDYPGYLGLFARGGAGIAEKSLPLEKLLADLELKAVHSFLRLNLGVRLGPALGLLGTLLPLGPALLSLSDGGLSSAAGELATAFATTVVGLSCGSVCYALALVRRKWYAADIADASYIFKLIHGESDE